MHSLIDGLPTMKTLAVTAIAVLTIAIALSGCDRGFTEAEKAALAKKCTDAGQEPEIHSSWVICRSPNQVSDE